MMPLGAAAGRLVLYADRPNSRRGGDDLGPTVVAGRPDESPLIQVLTGAKQPQVPENADPLPATEIDLLRRRIAKGTTASASTKLARWRTASS